MTTTPPSSATFLTRFTVRLALFYGAVFLIVGSYIPYFPVWLDWRGLGKSEIAMILATPLLVRIFFTPAITFLADRLGDRRRILIMLAWSTLLTLLLLSQMRGFWSIFLLSVLFSLSWTTIMPLTESVAMAGVKHAGLDYGRMRLWGSLTFIAMSFAGGYVIDGFAAPSAMALFLAAAIVQVIAAHLLPAGAREHGQRPSQPPSPENGVAGTANGSRLITSPGESTPHGRPGLTRQISLKSAGALMTNRLFILFLLTASLIQGTHAIYYTFGTLHWQSLGIPTGTIGALWATGVFAEIILFAASGAAVARFGITGLVLLGGLAAALRWLLTAQDPALWLLFPLQALHAASFGATHLGAVHFITAAVPDDYAATAQGIYASFSMGIIMGAITITAGPLYAELGAQAYLVMGLLGGLGALGAWLLHTSWDGRPLPVGRKDGEASPSAP